MENKFLYLGEWKVGGDKKKFLVIWPFSSLISKQGVDKCQLGYTCNIFTKVPANLHMYVTSSFEVS